MGLYNILLVDSEAGNLNALSRALRRDYTVFSANSGEDASDIIERGNIALIITDYHINGLPGAKLMEEALKGNSNIVRIFLVEAVDEKLLLESTRKDRTYGYITKPWEPEEVRSIVRDGVMAYEMVRTGGELDAWIISRNGNNNRNSTGAYSEIDSEENGDIPDQQCISRGKVALILSFIYCGLGQLYKGKVQKGISYIVIYTLLILSYFFAPSPPLLNLAGLFMLLLIWLAGMLDAYIEEEVLIEKGKWLTWRKPLAIIYIVVISGAIITILVLWVPFPAFNGSSASEEQESMSIFDDVYLTNRYNMQEGVSEKRDIVIKASSFEKA